MSDVIVPALVGFVLVLIGISNMKGNISTLHWYHRRRVSEEERLPFGRMTGLGSIIVGIGVMLGSGLNFAALQTGNGVFETLASVVVGVALVIGLGLSFYAMIKYNKGIF